MYSTDVTRVGANNGFKIFSSLNYAFVFVYYVCGVGLLYRIVTLISTLVSGLYMFITNFLVHSKDFSIRVKAG
jgi:hypothetical protein